MYSTSAASSTAGNRAHTRAAQESEDLKQRVTAVIDIVDHAAGDVATLITNDLESSAAESELQLLPKDLNVSWKMDISEECSNMMRGKIERYQRQHAHEMALNNMIDVLVSWDCSSSSLLSESDIRMVPEEERHIVDQAHDCSYKYLDWDLLQANRTESEGPGEKHCPEDEAENSKGGFYTCIPEALLQLLINLSPRWGITAEIVVAPKLMTTAEQEEMASYEAARRSIEESKKLQKELIKEAEKREAQRIAEEEHKERRDATYARATEAEGSPFKRVNVHIDQGGLGGHS